MTRSTETLGVLGWLALVAVCVAQQGCAAGTPKPADVKSEIAKIVSDARDAQHAVCPDATKVCAVYTDAVKSGYVQADDVADLACAGIATACALK